MTSRLLVCTATAPEHAACAQAIRTAGVRGLEPLRVGVGPARAALSLRKRLANGPRPTRILSCGFAGALDSGVPLGTWVTADALAEWRGGVLTPGAPLAPLPAAALDFPCRVCELVSADELVTRDSPLRHRRSNRPLVVDMESAALAREAAALGVPVSIARLVSDTPEQPLPELLVPFTAALSAVDAGARLGFAARGVGSALADPRAAVRLLVAGRRLTEQLRSDFQRLAPLLQELA